MMIYHDDDTEPMSALAVARLLNGRHGGGVSDVFRIPGWCHGERSVETGLMGAAIVYQHPSGSGVGVRCLLSCSDADSRQALLEAVQSVHERSARYPSGSRHTGCAYHGAPSRSAHRGVDA